MKRHWTKTLFRAMLLVLGISALSGGAFMQAQAAGNSPALAHQFYYGPANCHSDPTLPEVSGSRQQYADYIVNVIAPRYHLEAAVLLWQVNRATRSLETY